MSNPLMGMMCGMPGGNSPFGMIQKMMGMMQSTGYDMVYITEIQSEIHDKYKKKMKGIEV